MEDQTHLQHDAARTIERFFSETGPTYDQVVSLFTLGIDRFWKKKMLAALPAAPMRVLDLACGTGILTFAIAAKYPQCHVTGVDISRGYLDVARAKAAATMQDNVTLLHQRAEDFKSVLPFDAVTASYLPKYADLDRLIGNVSAMLLPGGVVIFHDFTYPTYRLLQKTFAYYFKILQVLGSAWYPEWKAVFFDLPEVIRKTDWVSEGVVAMKRHGLDDIRVTSLTLQGAALITARKPLPHGEV